MNEPSARRKVPDESLRLSLASILLLMTLAAVIFTIGRVLPADQFAGLCGVLASLYLFISLFWDAPHPLASQVDWLLLTIYLLAIVHAARA